MKTNKTLHGHEALITKLFGVLALALILFFPKQIIAYHGEEESALVCRQNIQFSIGSTGDTPIPPEVLLSGNHPDYSIFVVEIIDPATGDDIVTCDMVGTTIDVMVTDTSQTPSNSCWTSVHVEDKLPPVVVCNTLELPCTTDPFEDDYTLFLDVVEDNCTDEADLDIWFSQTISSGNCNAGYVAQLNRIWYVTDESGNTQTCNQTILLTTPSLNDIVFPSDTSLACPADNVSPDVTGRPTLGGLPIADVCGLNVWFTDKSADACGNAETITRTWRVMDWCTGQTIIEDQIIEIIDETPPVLNCPNHVLIVPNFPGECYGFYSVPPNLATDECANSAYITYTIETNGQSYGNSVQLDVGLHDLTITATDPCGNASSCEITVDVRDTEVPEASCTGQVVSLGNETEVTLRYDDFHSYTFYDNCKLVDTMIRRMSTNCNMPSDEHFGDEVTFCCQDVGEEVMVLVKVTDESDNMQICMFNVQVQDLTPPTINCPADVTALCTDIGGPDELGMATADDNCNVTVTFFDVDNLDNCSEGSILRNFVATDDFGNTASCIQTITVINPFNFDPDSITWPADTMLIECDADSFPSTTGMPVFQGSQCFNVSITFNDVIQDPDSACLVIRREWSVFDSCDMVGADSTQIIIIKNNAPPVLSGPGDVLVYATDVQCEQMVNLPPVVANDCSTGITVTNDYNGQGGNINDIFAFGENEITYTATDVCGNTSTLTITVTVVDTIPPDLNCPADIEVDNDPGLCAADVDVPLPDVSDNCEVDTFLNDITNMPDASGIYEVGTTTVTYTATDVSGNISTCSFDITVIDSENPSITCPSDVIVNNDQGECSAFVPIPVPTTSDNCAVDQVSNDFNGTADASGTYPVGITTVTYTVTDVNGNDTTCSFTVTVNDNEDPTIDCPDDITMETVQGQCVAAVTLVLSTFDDNCGVSSVTNSFNSNGADASGNYPLGETEVIFTVMDSSGNTAQCTTTVTVVDNEAPSINCPNDVVDDIDQGTCEAFIPLVLTNFSDNCVIDTVFNSYNNGGADASDNYPLGTTDVIFTVIDESGNMAVCTTSVTIRDNEDPTLTCPPDVTVDADPDSCNAFVNLELTIFDDNCGVESVTNSYNSNGADASDIYPAGMTDVIFTVTDTSGNTAVCTTTVTVLDTMMPNIACPTDITVNADMDSCSAFVNLMLVSFDDNCGVESVTNTFNNGGADASGDYPVGETDVIFTVSDASGNTVQCTTTVTVLDTVPPMLTCPVDMTVNSDSNSCFAFVDVMLTNFSDPCGIESVTNSFNSGGADASGEYPVGVTDVIFTVTDSSGNVAVCTTTVTVIGITEPTLTCPADLTVDAGLDSCSAFVNLELIDFSGNCGEGIESVTNNINNGGADASDVYPVGTTTVIFTVTDSAGNSAQCTTLVTVVDNQSPVLSCPQDVTVSADQDSCSAFVNLVLTVFSDNCGVDSVANSYNNGGADASDTYPAGTTNVVFEVFDSSGNSAICLVSVTVEDSIPPMITAPADITLSADTTACEATIASLVPTFSDNCGTPTVTNDFNGMVDAGGTFPVGVTVVTWTATDMAGNTAMDATSVTVVDDLAPIITFCPPDVTIDCDSMFLPLSQFGDATATDNCILNTVQDTVFDVNSCSNTGTITRTWTFSDTSGNSSVCTQIITLNGGVDVLDSLDFIWPPAVIVLDSCNGTQPADLPGGAPMLDPAVQTCNQVDITFTDSVSQNSQFGCFDIIRTWTVADLCNADSTTGDGIFIYVQIISINDTLPPVFANPPSSDTFYVGMDTCIAVVTLPDCIATDDCDNNVDVINDSPFADNNGPNASGDYPLGVTIVNFIATDDCGNSDTLQKEIVVLDTIAPTLECVKVLFQIEDNDSVTVPASVLVVQTADNCTDTGNIVITFDPNDLTDTVDIYTCDDIGEIPLNVYVVDESGNVAFCRDTIAIADENGFCPDNLMGLAGAIHTPAGNPVAGADVHVNIDDHIDHTDDQGTFEVMGLDPATNYVVVPYKNDDLLNGVTAFDLAMIQRHILDIAPFEYPHQYIAADVDHSEDINIIDIVSLRKVILGISNRFPNNLSWRFIDARYDMTGMGNPLLFELPENVAYLPLAQSRMNTDFIGIKVGDVDGSSQSNAHAADNRSSGWSALRISDRFVEEGDRVQVAINTTEDLDDYAGGQFTILIEDGSATLKGVVEQRSAVGPSEYAMVNGQLGVVWLHEQGVLQDDLVVIELEIHRAGRLSDIISLNRRGLKPELYTKSMRVMQAELIFTEDESDAASYELFQNIPNPFSQRTMIQFSLERADEYQLNILDNAGRRIWSTRANGNAGLNQVEISKEQLGSSGIMYYQLITDDFAATKRMILMQD